MASKQKTKGSGYERDVAKFLTELYGENFVRTIGSGAFIGGINRSRTNYLTEEQTRSHKGDVTPPASFKYVNIECKFYQDFPFNRLFTGNASQLDTWIEQVLEVEDEGDVNIIFMKFNRKGQYVCYEKKSGIPVEQALHYKDDWYVIEFNKFFEEYSEHFKASCGALDKSSV